MQMIAPERVPWRDLTDVTKVLKLKTEFSSSDPDPVFRGVQAFIKSCRSLKYDEDPDYGILANHISGMLFDEKKFENKFEEAFSIFVKK